jgi:hypothetical protein
VRSRRRPPMRGEKRRGTKRSPRRGKARVHSRAQCTPGHPVHSQRCGRERRACGGAVGARRHPLPRARAAAAGGAAAPIDRRQAGRRRQTRSMAFRSHADGPRRAHNPVRLGLERVCPKLFRPAAPTGVPPRHADRPTARRPTPIKLRARSRLRPHASPRKRCECVLEGQDHPLEGRVGARRPGAGGARGGGDGAASATAAAAAAAAPSSLLSAAPSPSPPPQLSFLSKPEDSASGTRSASLPGTLQGQKRKTRTE